MFMRDGPDKNKDNFFESFTSSSFVFKPVAESTPSLFLGAASKVIMPGSSPQIGKPLDTLFIIELSLLERLQTHICTNVFTCKTDQRNV